MYFGVEKCLPAGLGTNEGVVLNSHCSGASVFKIHTPLSILQACLIGTNSGLIKDVFGAAKPESSDEMIGLSCYCTGRQMKTRGFMLRLKCFYVAGVLTDLCVVSGSKEYRRYIGFKAALEEILKVIQ